MLEGYCLAARAEARSPKTIATGGEHVCPVRCNSAEMPPVQAAYVKLPNPATSGVQPGSSICGIHLQLPGARCPCFIRPDTLPMSPRGRTDNPISAAHCPHPYHSPLYLIQDH